MRCPHCLVEFHDKSSSRRIGKDIDGECGVRFRTCPACHRLVVEIVRGNWTTSDSTVLVEETGSTLVYPKAVSRTPLGLEVPDPFAQDYREACLVLNDSPKASAALSRRCLQHLLREKAGVTPSNLSKEIQEVLDSGKLPSLLADAIDAVRSLGNFAAHPIKSTNTGEIVDVEPEEAEWILDTLEGLFDFYFVQPARLKAKRDKLNQKLKDAGKQGMK